MQDGLSLKKLYLNIGSGAFVQACNMLIPLISLPFLTRSLGVESFGRYVLGFAIATYSGVIVEWGFSMSATRDVARNRSDIRFLSQLYVDVTVARILLALTVSLIILCSAIFLSGPSRAVVAVSVISALAGAFTCDWLLVGLEKGAVFAFATLAGRVFQLGLVLTVVRNTGDAWLAVGANGIGLLLTAALTTFASMRLLGIETTSVSLRGGLRMLRKSKHFFLIKSAVQLYAAGGPLLLSPLAGAAAAAIYGGADRIARAGLGFVGQISINVIPRINALAAQRPEDSNSFLRVAAFVQLAITLCGAITVFVFSKTIVVLLLGNDFYSVVPVLRILAPLLVLVAFGNILGVQILVAQGHGQLLSKITLAGLLIYIPTCAFGASIWGPEGAAIAIVFTEISVIFAESLAVRTLCPTEWRALTGWN
jgi:PST family polysaccharide transporter